VLGSANVVLFGTEGDAAGSRLAVSSQDVPAKSAGLGVGRFDRVDGCSASGRRARVRTTARKCVVGFAASPYRVRVQRENRRMIPKRIVAVPRASAGPKSSRAAVSRALEASVSPNNRCETESVEAEVEETRSYDEGLCDPGRTEKS